MNYTTTQRSGKVLIWAWNKYVIKLPFLTSRLISIIRDESFS